MKYLLIKITENADQPQHLKYKKVKNEEIAEINKPKLACKLGLFRLRSQNKKTTLLLSIDSISCGGYALIF